MIYIQRLGDGYRETVAECVSRKDALNTIREYRLSEPDAVYYLSSRACKGWNE